MIKKILNILGKEYEVFFKDRTADDGVGTKGTFLGYKQKIWIDLQCAPQEQKSTLLHEIIEAINWMTDLDLSHQTISTLETALFQVLESNGLWNL